MEWFDLSLEENPGYIVCLYRKGVALFHKLQPANANKSLALAIRLYCENSDADFKKRNAKYYYKSVFYLGKTYQQLGQKNNALACFTKMQNEDKRHYVDEHFIKFNLAKSLFSVDKKQEALDILKQLQKKEYVFDLIGQIYCSMEELSQAKHYFDKAINLRPCSYLFCHRAQLFERMGDLNSALRDYSEGVKRDRIGKHKFFYALGKIALKQNCISEAQNYFTRANAFKNKLYGKEYLEAHLGLAECYELLNQKDKAKDEYKIAATLKSQWQDYYVEYEENPEVQL